MNKRFFVCVVLMVLLLNSGIGTTVAQSPEDNSTINDPIIEDIPVEDPVDDQIIDTSSVDDIPAEYHHKDSFSPGYVLDDTSIDNPIYVDQTDVGSTVDDIGVENNLEDEIQTDNSGTENQLDNPVNNTPIGNISVGNQTEYPVNYTQTNNTSIENSTKMSKVPYYEYSPESSRNILYVNTNQVYINNEQNVNIDITNVNSVVNNINFDATKASGKATIVVEDLKDKSCLVDKPPAGDIYKSFNIWIENAGANNIENAAVNFHVEKAWLNKNKLDKTSIVLNMYGNGKWTAVPVTIISEDTKYVYYTAKVSGYSSFAITGQKVILEQKAMTKQPDQTVVVSDTSLKTEEISNKNEIIRLLEYIIELLR